MRSAAQPLRLAMWSGPRSVSTAMMRAFENRPDTVVVDEPFYAYYLQRTSVDHPGAAEVLAEGVTDWRQVVESLRQPLSEVKSIFFQKQMALHLLPEIDRSWLADVTSCFLIREPRDVITSYIAQRPRVDLFDLGFVQQSELYRWVTRNTEQAPPVVDARDLQNHPRPVLEELCGRIGVPFDERMLGWPPGARATDGVWAPHWYAAVEKSTGFSAYRPRQEAVPERLREIYEVCLDEYQKLYEHRIRP